MCLTTRGRGSSTTWRSLKRPLCVCSLLVCGAGASQVVCCGGKDDEVRIWQGYLWLVATTSHKNLFVIFWRGQTVFKQLLAIKTSQDHFSIWQFVDTLFRFCHNMFHSPVTKYQKLTSQGSRVAPIFVSCACSCQQLEHPPGWEITALDKQTGKHSCNYGEVLMIQEETLKSNSLAKLWLLRQHPNYQSRLWVNNLARGSYEKFMPQKANDKKEKWLNPLSSGCISPGISAAFWLQRVCRFFWFTDVFQKPLLSSVSLRQWKALFSIFLILLVCVNHPADDVLMSSGGPGRCRSITAAVRSDLVTLTAGDAWNLSY